MLKVYKGIGRDAALFYHMGKSAFAYEPAYNLSGMLYATEANWLMLTVPNALAKGVYDAMNEPGVILPPGPNDKSFSAHITVMRPEEIELIGGKDKITERGHQFRYTLGRFVSVKPENWPQMDTAYMLLVHSPALQELRRSYGLSSLPNSGEYAFHITVAVKPKGILGRNPKSKSLVSR